MTIAVLMRFGSDRKGTTAVIFGFSAMLLMLTIGIAVDSARLYSISDKVRGALDAAALAGAKLLDVEDATDADVRMRAAAYFETYRTGITDASVDLVNFSTTTNRADGTVTASVDVSYDTAFGKLMSMAFVKFSPSATVYYKAKKIELSLVLDVTGSMGSGGKMPALKQAAKDLIDVLQANSPDPGTVRVAIAPYSSAVNVGNAYYTTATGLGPGADTCVVERSTMPGAVFDDQPGPGRYASTSYFDWSNAPPGNGQYSCPTTEIMPLQDISLPERKAAAVDLIDSLAPDGFTAGHIGAAWGWYMVSSRWQGVWPPASRPRNAGPEVLKAVLLMTDGEFNTAYFGGNKNGDDFTVVHSSGDQALRLCQNMRDAGIVVFTVAFDAPPNAETLLKLCAGSPANAFIASNASELNAKFRQIGDRLSMLRLAK